MGRALRSRRAAAPSRARASPDRRAGGRSTTGRAERITRNPAAFEHFDRGDRDPRLKEVGESVGRTARPRDARSGSRLRSNHEREVLRAKRGNSRVGESPPLPGKTCHQGVCPRSLRGRRYDPEPEATSGSGPKNAEGIGRRMNARQSWAENSAFYVAISTDPDIRSCILCTTGTGPAPRFTSLSASHRKSRCPQRFEQDLRAAPGRMLLLERHHVLGAHCFGLGLAAFADADALQRGAREPVFSAETDMRFSTSRGRKFAPGFRCESSG